MKFVRFRYKSKTEISILEEKRIIDLTGLHETIPGRSQENSLPHSMEQLIETSEKIYHILILFLSLIVLK